MPDDDTTPDDETQETQTEEETQEMLQKLRTELFGPSNEPDPPAGGRRRRPDEEYRRLVTEIFRPSS